MTVRSDERPGDRPVKAVACPYWLPAAGLFVGALGLYASTLAPATLFGDPSEYQFVPAIAGIAHPPGYAVYILVARLWQMAVPLGTIAYRTNLLSAVLGAWVVALVYLVAAELLDEEARGRRVGRLGPAFAALALAVAPDFWQHSIHANSHILSAALGATHLWLLVRWWRTRRDGWLAGWAFTLGLAAAHHPVTLIGAPAYAVFVLVTQPRLLRRWRTLVVLAGCMLIGLAPLLYYPLRSPAVGFGPTDMRTWEGFWRHTTAQGLRVNLFHFGLRDQPDRALVFWSLLRLQFPLPVIALLLMGLIRSFRRTPKPALLLGLYVLCHVAFTLNTVQDVMAYLLLPFTALAMLLGAGARLLLELLMQALKQVARSPRLNRGLAVGAWAVLLLVWPLWQAGVNLARGISLRDFMAAEEHVAAVHEQFVGQGQRARLLAAWEYLTPLWTHAHTQEEPLDKQDVKLVFVSTSAEWGPALQANLEKGPVYLPDYRPAVGAAGLRLVPAGRFYRAVRPPVSGVSPSQTLDSWADGRVHLLGYDLLTDTVEAGGWLELTLYQSVAEPLDGIWMPYAELGALDMRWTTDSRLLTTQWLPDETIVERYEIPVPFNLAPGQYPLRLGYADLTGGRSELTFSNGETTLGLATITVLPDHARPPERMLSRALANLDNQVALTDVRVQAGWQRRSGQWEDPLRARRGQSVHLTLTWGALASPRESYTVFIHLLDEAGRYVTGYDYTPLGGSCPTYLWFPKWLPGQTFIDPYRLALPADLLPGTYWLEVGMYSMTSLKRLPVVDSSDGLAGDRVVLGPVRVE